MAVNHWNPERGALCTCGWSGRFATLRAANRAIDLHKEEGCEGCGHDVDIFDWEVK